ncbi:MAG TPA: C13 family peptidase [Burkholderiales bacterium]|nr:C13 family peptidase [Burkholderiales bacterium]
MAPLLRIVLLVSLLCAGVALSATRTLDARTPDGATYYGTLVDGVMHGRGRLEWPNGAYYEGGFERGLFSGTGWYRNLRGDTYEGVFRNGSLDGPGTLEASDVSYRGGFKQWEFWGHGEAMYGDGRKYVGEFVRSRFHGKGRYEHPDGDVYEGDFEDGDFKRGVHTTKDGRRSEGAFVKWRLQGHGRVAEANGMAMEGHFDDGELNGPGRLTSTVGVSYEGAFKASRPHGTGTLRLPNGDVYQGSFARGLYEGEGVLTYAKPQADGRTQDKGTWRYGRLRDEAQERLAALNVETALYNQRKLLDQALAALKPRDPSKINMYLLAVAGDGSQEVFRREVQFVREQFDRDFQTAGRSVALINSRNTVASAPMATVTGIREALQAIAARMDRDNDILFLFVTSHGSESHELTLAQNNMQLRGLKAAELAGLLAETKIRWKVVVVSACYSGGFIDAVKDEDTLVITAARQDRRSFGCSDDNDFTYFGRAFFKESLNGSGSFTDAFRKAEKLVREWETAETKGAAATEAQYSLPQIAESTALNEHLRRWRSQLSR